MQFDFHCRYSHHHHQNMVEKRKRNPRKLAPLKRKPPTIPVNPFKSKDKRNLERPWLKSPKSNAGRYCFALVR